MTKLDLAQRVSKTTGLKGSLAMEAVEATIAGIREGVLEHGSVCLRGFGTFKKVRRASRTIKYGVAGGGKMVLPERDCLSFKPSKYFKL